VIVAGMGGPIAVNHLAIWKWLERYEDELSRPINIIFEQVCRVAQEVINESNENEQIKQNIKEEAKQAL